MKKGITKLLVAALLFSLVPPKNNQIEATSVEDENIVSYSQLEEEVVEKRTATSQVFKQEDGSYRMDVYPEPIHVQNEKTDEWEVIDNTLTKSKTGRIQNENSEFSASFSPNMELDEPILAVKQQDKSVVIESIQQNGSESGDAQALVNENKVIYKDIYPNTDLSYSVSNFKIKEDILLKARPDSKEQLEYTFQFDISGLQLEKTKDGYLFLQDSKTKERLFALEMPFMMDSSKPDGFVSYLEAPMPEGAWSDQIEMIAEQSGDKLTITLQPNMDWLHAPERVYPVVIDPTLKVYQPKKDLDDATIRSALPDTTGGADLELGAGYHSNSNNVVRSLLKFDLGTLPKGAKIMSAQLNLRLSSVWNQTPSNIQLFEMNNTWEENRATWNRRTLNNLWSKKGGDYTPVSLSNQTIGGLDTTLEEPPLFKWAISDEIIDKWINHPSQNLGLMLKAQNESLATYKKFYSGDSSGATGDLKYSPKLSVVYYPESRLGLEDYWSYSEHEISDGQGYVNLGTGNLVVENIDFSVSGRGNSGFSFARTYNSKAVEDSSVGYGWSYTGSDTITQYPNYDVLYQQEDGSIHHFIYEKSTGTYKAPPGTYMKLIKANTDSFVLTDYNGYRGVFRDLIKDVEAPSRIYRLDYEEDRNKNKITYERDVDGKLKSITDASGRTLALGYENGRIVSTNFEGTKKTAYTYDTSGNLKTSTIYKDGSTGSITSYTYNTNGELASITDANDQVTIYTYNSGFLTNVQQPTITDSGLSKTTFSYDIANYSATEIDPNGNQTEYLLDSNYVIIETIDPLGNIETNKYDDQYNPIMETDALGNQTINTYDAKGNLLTTTDPLGNKISYSYNDFSQPVTITDSKGTTTNVYNNVGDLIEEVNPAGEKTIHEYDIYGNLSSTSFSDGTIETYIYDENKNYQKSVTDPLGRTTITTQDKFGNTTSVTDPALNRTNYTYDLRNLLTQVKDADGNITNYEYDANGNLHTAINAAKQKTLFTYNGQNQLESRKEPMGETSSFVYDVNGNIKETIAPSKDRLQNIYNQNDQLVHIAVNGSRKWTFNYDPNGNMNWVLNVVTGEKKNFYYDKNQKMTKSSLGEQSIEYVFDGTGVATQAIGKSKTQMFTQSYIIDSLERLSHIKRNGASQVSLTYNNTDALESISYVNGIKSTYKYDVAGQIKTLVITKDDGTVDTFSYDHDNRGNIISVTSNAGTAMFQYDNNNQLTQESTVDGKIITYEYDVVGNRTKQVTNYNGEVSIKDYSYNANNQLTASNNQLYLYDNNGNRTQDGKYKYVYNKLNELVKIMTLDDQTVATYTYDEDGKRISKTINGQTTYFHYDDNQVLFETNASGSITAEYSYDDFGRPLTMTKDGQTYYYVLNEHKDVTALTDISGNIVASYIYDAWGNILSQSGPMADINPYRYASYRYDNETDLYYLIARYYQPKEGIFFSIDPQPGMQDDPISQHPYVYVQNNPVMLDDPDGENPIFAVLLWQGGRYVVKYVAKKSVKHAAKKYKGNLKSKFKKSKYKGRSGKQAKLRELANDDKVSRSLRGEIKRDINLIKKKKRKTIRVPKGYNLAHKTGFEARKGYGYKHTRLQEIRGHRNYHKIHGYK
ncbi:polymorphic toxin type 8 domain-containing protein [Cytobacillus gottheilii]|uniref:polymorphic toxin type 8 domain-containing protein n=1 Tax=Cytobacillus gottheilii TaxID=859144 RepID=UPI00249455FD|nr:polymorphic toxin type 8 domain-containing protein [Cytobacillus gottheilii]